MAERSILTHELLNHLGLHTGLSPLVKTLSLDLCLDFKGRTSLDLCLLSPLQILELALQPQYLRVLSLDPLFHLGEVGCLSPNQFLLGGNGLLRLFHLQSQLFGLSCLSS